ncbi:MAG: 50S ribosomal protein L4 [Thermoplasmata archaeon]|nr:50S ribosomal protein L4 [Thermoplasmata archaeon]MBE3137307.1 50S ribosomal protein L4 [Thermoplasmata archaeon]MBE3141747.1 50S ribosomal protein L4 [Thermoplasmata archaeon]
MTKVNVYSMDGTVKEKIDLPKIFDTPYRPDIIKKSFEVIRSNQRQPYGSDPLAGTRHAVASVGKGRGMSRVPRLTQGQAAALAPCVVGGRRAHPPKVERNWKEKMNKKENQLARNSALAATADTEVVKKRGHRFDDKITLPIIVDDDFEKIKKTKEVIEVLEKIGIYSDVLRSANGKHVRAGKGKMRGRRYRTPKSLLIVSTKETIEKSSDNLSGVDIAKPHQLNIEHLAPGGIAGRLTIITKSALTQLGGAK